MYVFGIVKVRKLKRRLKSAFFEELEGGRKISNPSYCNVTVTTRNKKLTPKKIALSEIIGESIFGFTAQS